MRDFRKRYKEFTDWMVDFLKDKTEYQQFLLILEENRRDKIRFVEDLFRMWLNDKDKIDWLFRHEMLKRGL